MKKELLFIGAFALLSVLNSCDDKDEGSQSDTIQLSNKNIAVTDESKTIQVTTKGDSWDFYGIAEKYEGNESLNKKIGISERNLTELSGDWYSIKRKKKKEIEISVSENTLNTNRQLIIDLGDKNYFDAISILQYSK
ncbi:hypothetical protein E2605_18180 [Dysgonomonas capnocytophagoides]|uniref:BACON domain-containing protein n=1 Tax=Dysgonomonas capnocytophagoides TaxID=45254 RepID=A0A4Y8KXA6_9BACT|nr:hypothetical protein [Dysgonomonas capnocytophagoides]TFD92773.1 hypothetical protein E2605_18180 [Dysgonomonas capnocytophagoides]